jgi:hypothetical protein
VSGRDCRGISFKSLPFEVFVVWAQTQFYIDITRVAVGPTETNPSACRLLLALLVVYPADISIAVADALIRFDGSASTEVGCAFRKQITIVWKCIYVCVSEMNPHGTCTLLVEIRSLMLAADCVACAAFAEPRRQRFIPRKTFWKG